MGASEELRVRLLRAGHDDQHYKDALSALGDILGALRAVDDGVDEGGRQRTEPVERAMLCAALEAVARAFGARPHDRGGRPADTPRGTAVYQLNTARFELHDPLVEFSLGREVIDVTTRQDSSRRYVPGEAWRVFMAIGAGPGITYGDGGETG